MRNKTCNSTMNRCKPSYCVPDSHINGMSSFANQKIEVERHNYKYNF